MDKLTHNLNHYKHMVNDGAPVVVFQRKFCDRLHNLQDPQLWKPAFRQFYLADTHNMLHHFAHVPGVEHVRARFELIRDGAY